MAIVHPREPLAYGDAVKYVADWLTEHALDQAARDQGYTAKVYDYFDGDAESGSQSLAERPFCGVRVSEVDFSNKRGGGSYMQTEPPWGIAVCGQVERCILALIEGWNRESEIFVADDGEEYGETDNEFSRLEELFKLANVPPGTANADQYEAIIGMFERTRSGDEHLADNEGLAYGVLSILEIKAPDRKESSDGS